jgi:hypothetical protein
MESSLSLDELKKAAKEKDGKLNELASRLALTLAENALEDGNDVIGIKSELEIRLKPDYDFFRKRSESASDCTDAAALDSLSRVFKIIAETAGADFEELSELELAKEEIAIKRASAHGWPKKSATPTFPSRKRPSRTDQPGGALVRWLHPNPKSIPK